MAIVVILAVLFSTFIGTVLLPICELPEGLEWINPTLPIVMFLVMVLGAWAWERSGREE